MQVKLKSIHLDRSHIDMSNKYIGYNYIEFITKGNLKIQFPISIECFEEIEKLLLTDMKNCIKEQIEIAAKGDDKLQFYSLPL